MYKEIDTLMDGQVTVIEVECQLGMVAEDGEEYKSLIKIMLWQN